MNLKEKFGSKNSKPCRRRNFFWKSTGNAIFFKKSKYLWFGAFFTFLGHLGRPSTQVLWDPMDPTLVTSSDLKRAASEYFGPGAQTWLTFRFQPRFTVHSDLHMVDWSNPSGGVKFKKLLVFLGRASPTGPPALFSTPFLIKKGLSTTFTFFEKCIKNHEILVNKLCFIKYPQ